MAMRFLEPSFEVSRSQIDQRLRMRLCTGRKSIARHGLSPSNGLPHLRMRVRVKESVCCDQTLPQTTPLRRMKQPYGPGSEVRTTAKAWRAAA